MQGILDGTLEILGFWDFGISGLWRLRDFGISGLWDFGTLGFRDFGDFGFL